MADVTNYYGADYFKKRRETNSAQQTQELNANQTSYDSAVNNATTAYNNAYGNATTAYNNAYGNATNTYNNAYSNAGTAYNNTVTNANNAYTNLMNNAQNAYSTTMQNNTDNFNAYKAQLDRSRLNSTAQLASAKENAKIQMANYLKALGLQGSGLGQSAIVQNNANYMNNVANLENQYNDNMTNAYNEYQNASRNALAEKNEREANALAQRDERINNATAERDIAYSNAATARDNAYSDATAQRDTAYSNASANRDIANSNASSDKAQSDLATNRYYGGREEDINKEEASYNYSEQNRLEDMKVKLAEKGIDTKNVNSVDDYIDSLSTWANKNIEDDKANTVQELRNTALREFGLTTQQVEQITDVDSFQKVVGDYNQKQYNSNTLSSKYDADKGIIADYQAGNITYDEAVSLAQRDEFSGSIQLSINSWNGRQDNTTSYSKDIVRNLQTEYYETMKDENLSVEEANEKLSEIADKLDYYGDVEKGYGTDYDIKTKLGTYTFDTITSNIKKPQLTNKEIAQIIAYETNNPLEGIDFINDVGNKKNGDKVTVLGVEYHYEKGKWNSAKQAVTEVFNSFRTDKTKDRM